VKLFCTFFTKTWSSQFHNSVSVFTVSIVVKVFSTIGILLSLTVYLHFGLLLQERLWN